eukprot:876565-Pyramimonas_sp.AAC.1
MKHKQRAVEKVKDPMKKPPIGEALSNIDCTNGPVIAQLTSGPPQPFVWKSSTSSSHSSVAISSGTSKAHAWLSMPSSATWHIRHQPNSHACSARSL